MPRFPFNVKTMLAILMLLMVAGSVCAQNTPEPAVHSEPLEYYRVFVPAGQPELWPMQGERYIPIPSVDFQKLLDSANQTIAKTPFSSPEVKVSSADYQMTLKTEATETASETYFLAGHAHLHVVTTAKDTTKDRFLTLGPAAGMNLQNPTWTDGKQPVPTGTDAGGHLVAKIDRSGSFEFDLMTKNRSTKPGELRFELKLPLATRSAVTLSLDPAWTVSVTSGLLLDRSAKDPSEPVRWTVAPALDGQLDLSLVQQKDPKASPEIPNVEESLVYEFSPRGLELSSLLRLSSPGEMLPKRLRLSLEKPLTLTSARLGSQPVKWTLESEEPDRSIVSLVLPPSRPRKATLRLKAACPIVENGNWQLPRIMPEKFFWQSGNITLLVTSPLSIGKLIPVGCIRTKAGELPDHQGRSIELTAFRPNATATVSLGWERDLPTLTSATVAELSVVGTTVTQNLNFTATKEDCFELSAMVQPDWVIDSVESVPGSMIADWRVVPLQDSSREKLVIRLASALSKQHGTLRLQLSARRLQSPLGKRLSMQDITPVLFNEVQRDRCLTTITAVDPYTVSYRNEEFADSVSLDEVSVGQDSLFSRIPPGKIFVDNSRSARLEILLEEQKPVYAATIETVATITEEKLVEHYRFRCDPEASRIDRLYLHLSGEEEKQAGLNHESCVLHFLPGPVTSSFREGPSTADTVPSGFFTPEKQVATTLSPEDFTAVKLTPANQASVGMISDGETWEILLKTPRSKPFELYAVQTYNFDSKLPVTIQPRLAAMPKAVEHHATLQIETTDAASIRIKNRRLEPIAITPTSPLQIQKHRAAFRYETTDALAPAGDPSLSLTVNSPERTSLLVWKCIVQTEQGGDGLVQGIARYELENQGESRLRLRIPKKATAMSIVDVVLDGQYVDWTPVYSTKVSVKAAPGNRGTSPSPRRLVAMDIDLPDTKRFVPVTVCYTYHTDSLGMTQRRNLLAPEPDCDVVGVDWRLLLPPGYEASNYVAVNDLPPGNLTNNGKKPSGESSHDADLSKVLSPKTAFCWRTCLFGPLGRPFSEPPFNPLSSESWSKVSDRLGHNAWATTLDGNKKTPSAKTEDHPDWKRYHLHSSNFGYTPSVRIVHRNSLEIFRWTIFLITLAAATWARSARWIRRLPPVILAAMMTIFLPPLTSAIASGFFMGVLVALLAVWLLENGGRYRSRRKTTSHGSGERSFSATATVITTAKSSRFTTSTGSTSAGPATKFYQPDSSTPREKPASTPDDSDATRIELGKPIDNAEDSATTEKPQEESPQPKTEDGSTSNGRTPPPPMLWLLAVSLLFAGATGNVVRADVPTSTPSEPSATASSTTRWPVLIPMAEASKPASENQTQNKAVPTVAPMHYLPEPFFLALEKIAERQVKDRDLWLLQNASLRVVLERTETAESIQPAYLFLTFGASCFSANTEIRLRLKKEEVQLKDDQVVLDGRPAPAQWSEDGSSLRIPVAGRGPHQLELTLIPLPATFAERWNAKAQRDETGFRIHLPCCPQAKLELTYPSNLPQPVVDHLLHATQSDTVTKGVLASENRLAVWWPKEMQEETLAKTPAKLDELLLMDVTPNLVTLEAIWSVAAGASPTTSAKNPTETTSAIHTDLTASRLRDLTISVDPQLRLLELTDGFTLQSLEDHPTKQHLHWNRATDPPKQVYAKFALEKVGGIGQFRMPILQADQSRVAHCRLGVRVASNLNYAVHLVELSGSNFSASEKSEEEKTSDTQAPATAKMSPEAFMEAWQERQLAITNATVPSATTDELSQNAAEPPGFVIADHETDWSFHTEPKSSATEVLQQTLRVSFGRTTASVRFDAEWYSGSSDMPEPTLRAPKNFLLRSAYLIDDGILQSIRWSSTKEGFIHLATGILPAKRRTIRVEGILEPLNPTQSVPLPLISLVGMEEVPVYLGLYRKPDALLKLNGKPRILDKPPASITGSWLQGQPVHWLQLLPEPQKNPDVRIRIQPNRPTIQARQVVTVVAPKQSESAGSSSTRSEETKPSPSQTVPNEMVASFELAPIHGVLDEIAVFVPSSVVGPFRTEPILTLLRSQDTDKGRTLIFRPKEPIQKRYRFQLSSPMETGETRIPNVRLCGADQLMRYVILPGKTAKGERQRWQTRLLNREKDPAILGELLRPALLMNRSAARNPANPAGTAAFAVAQESLNVSASIMPLPEDAKLYRVVGRQWLATASDSNKATQSPTASLADIQVRWQKDGTYLASAVFELDPAGNSACHLLVPEGLELLDTRIAGIPTSLTKLPSAETKTSTVGYRIGFTSKTLPQRIEVLYRNATGSASRLSLPRLGRNVCKTFRTPYPEVEIQQTRWTVQGPQTYTVRGKFNSPSDEETSAASFFEKTQDGTSPPALTPYLTEQPSLGVPIQKTFSGFQKEWTTAWRSRTPTRLAEQLPSALVLLTIGILAVIRPVRLTCIQLLRRHHPLFGIAAGLFWWFFLSPSILGWVIILAFLIVAYRTRSSQLEEDSTVIRIG